MAGAAIIGVGAAVTMGVRAITGVGVTTTGLGTNLLGIIEAKFSY